MKMSRSIQFAICGVALLFSGCIRVSTETIKSLASDKETFESENFELGKANSIVAKNLVSRSVTLPTFQAITASTGIKVDFKQGQLQRALISAPAEVISRVKLKITNGTLNAFLDSKGIKTMKGNPIVITLSAPDVANFSASTGAIINVDSLALNTKVSITASTGASCKIKHLSTPDDVKLESTTGASILIGNLMARNISADATTGASISGAFRSSLISLQSETGSSISANILAETLNASTETSAVIDIKGKAGKVDFSSETSGSIRASELIASNGDVKADTSGSIRSNIKKISKKSISTGGSLKNRD